MTHRLALALALAALGCGGGSPPAPGDSPPPPGERWRPAAGATPASGSYVYLESQPGDPVGGGETHTYTPADASIYVAAAAYSVAVNVVADVAWWGDLQPAAVSGRLRPGDYGDLQQFPSMDPNRGGLKWRAQARNCDVLGGWFVVDRIAYAADGTVTAIELRFGQRCQGSTGALHGQIHWSADDLAYPSGPGVQPPPTLWRPSAGATPSSGSYVYLESDPDDQVGGGRSYLYTPETARISVVALGDRLFVSVSCDQVWGGTFQIVGSPDRLQPGYYGDARRADLLDPGQSGLQWLGPGQVWPMITGAIGWFAIDEVTYEGGVLAGIDLRFEQHSQSAAPALRGKVHYSGPWQAPLGAPPGSYVYLESTPGDWVGDWFGGGAAYAYTPATAHISIAATGGRLAVAISRAQEWWTGLLKAASASGRIEPGHYPAPLQYPHSDPRDGLGWTHGWGSYGNGCNMTAGWIIVDDVTYVGDVLTGVALRFEQLCEGQAGVLHGQIRWSAADAIPAGLWRPAPGATPATGNYVYLESEPGDSIGAGQSHAYTESSGQMSIHDWYNRLSVGVAADQRWRGDFQVSWFVRLFEPGFYGELPRLEFDDAYATALYWRGEGRGCNVLTGWFAVDRAEYTVNALTALDLRFEQHCEGATAALHGQVHWSAAEAVAPSGPVEPPPASLWRPAAGSTPATGSYVFLESDPGDFIGGGLTHLYTPDAYRISAGANSGVLSLIVAGWDGDFQTMRALDRLEPGFYGGLERYMSPQIQPDRGALDWDGYSRGCNMLTGWFVVDAITYVGGILTAADLRFEQHCEDSSAALRGEIHWSGEIWRPAPGATPASGNYVYLESETGAIGGGQTYTFLQDAVPFTVGATGSVLSVYVPGDPFWTGQFRALGGLAQLEAGSYADLQDYWFGDPARGGLRWDRQGNSCTGGANGWFIVDRVAYASGVLAGIDMRFEQRCWSYAGPALHGQIHYDAP